MGLRSDMAMQFKIALIRPGLNYSRQLSGDSSIFSMLNFYTL